MPAPSKRRRWPLRLAAGLFMVTLMLAGGAIALIDTDIGHRLIADRIAALRPADGMRYSVGRISGSLWSKAVLSDVTVRDPHGLVFAAPRAELNWQPLAWFANRLDIRALHIARATLAKLPEPRPTRANRPILPDFDIALGALAIDRLTVGPAITGVAREGRLRALAEVRHGRALVLLDARVAGSDDVRLRLDAAPDRDRFLLNARAIGARHGLLARAAGIDKPIALSVDGRGGWKRWQGRAIGRIGGAPALDLALTNTAGRYAARGWARPDTVIAGKAARMFAPRLAITADARLADRVIDGALALRTAAFAAEARGAIDLGRSRYRDLRARLRLLDPPRVVDRMTAQNAELRLIASGPMSAAVIDYQLAADRLNFGSREIFEGVRAGGTVTLRHGEAVVPLAVSVARVSGVDPVAAEILRNLSLGGALRASARSIVGANLPLKSDKLDGRVDLRVEPGNGRFEIALNAALRRYQLKGLGLVDASARLRAVPAPGGGGAQITGDGEAQVLRLDNEFFAGVAEGQPHLTSRLAQGSDGVLHFDRAVLSAPAIRATINGFHRRDDTFHIEASGAHSRYGPLDIVIDGRIERPTIDLKLAHPNADLALEAVTARFDPTVEGYDFRTSGGSLLGDFTGRGQLLLPPGNEATIAVTALDVADLHAHGALRAAHGGLDGRLELGGRGTGGLGFSMVDKHQRVEAHLDLADAKLSEGARLRRGRVDLVALLDPDGNSLEAKASGAGLRQGNLALGRFAFAASLRGGTGTATAEASGTRGRAFDLHASAQITPDRYSITGTGQIDRRPITLDAPAVLTREGDGWRLAGAVLKFAEGEARLAGGYQDGKLSGSAALTGMPLSLLDIGWPGLGLSGSASGTLDYRDAPGRAPEGRIDLTVRGLSRAGLVLSSQPVDLGLAGVLGGERAGLRVVLASAGRTIGRAQARLAPLGGGPIADRLRHAGLFAQVRYDGPADTLWRLTGIELFDLSGPVAIGADVTGRVDDPRIVGVVKAKGARLESARTGTVLTNLQGDGRFTDSVLNVTAFTADAGKGGRVSGSGVFDLAAAHGFGIDLKLQTAKAVMINRDDIGATITGPISFHSDGDGGLITGDVVLDQSRYRLGQAVAASAVPKLNLREINLPDDEGDDAPPTKPWRLDVRARATNSLSVSGLGLTSLWSATMQLGGRVDEPTISGRADLTRGSVEFSGREFAISRGVIRFLGNSPPDPAIDIAATGDTTGLSATISVTGPASKPAIAFSSTPALPQDELLSRLLFGTSITNLSAPEAVQLASAVASLQSTNGGLNPINALRRVVGLDRLRILPADKTIGRTTAVAAGKYITRRLYAEIISDGQGYSATQVEFQITRWLSILSTISTIGRQSANVRVSKDY